MGVRSGVSVDTPGRIVIDAGAVYLNYGLTNQRLLGATRGGNEFNPGRVSRMMEVDGPKGGVKGMKRIIEVNPQITANLIELSVANLIAAIAGADQSDRGYIVSEWVAVGNGSLIEFDLNQNDVVENSERVYLSDALGAMTLLTRGTKYATRFVGTNLADNKEFEGGIGDWLKGNAGDTLAIATGGQVGNCAKFTAGAAAVTSFVTLPGGDGAVLTNLVVGQHYRLQVGITKKSDTFTPTHVNIKCTGGPVSTLNIVPSAVWKIIVYEFIATGTDATIELVGQAAPTQNDVLYIDHCELERVTGGATNYVMNYHDNDSTKASIIFPQDQIPAASEQIIVSYTYELAAPGVDTSITGGDIADADYITNVAIVGNVSGKTYPVICIIDNALADAGFSLALAPRDEAVPVVIFTGHYDPSDLDTEPWRVRWPNS